MSPLIPIFIVILVAVIFIIWWWSRRSDERPTDEPYHANPFTGTPTYEPAPTKHTPAEAEHGDGGGGTPATHHEAATEAPAAADAAIAVPELVLGDEAAITTETAVAEKQLGEITGHTTAQEVPASVTTPVEAVPPVTPVPPVEPPAPPSEEPKGDDLTVIEGIGPRVSSILQAGGIRTFDQLATAKPAAIKQLLTDSKLYTADPATWPQQAKLAAAGKWEQLKTLQDKLDGGRKV